MCLLSKFCSSLLLNQHYISHCILQELPLFTLILIVWFFAWRWRHATCSSWWLGCMLQIQSFPSSFFSSTSLTSPFSFSCPAKGALVSSLVSSAFKSFLTCSFSIILIACCSFLYVLHFVAFFLRLPIFVYPEQQLKTLSSPPPLIGVEDTISPRTTLFNEITNNTARHCLMPTGTHYKL